MSLNCISVFSQAITGAQRRGEDIETTKKCESTVSLHNAKHGELGFLFVLFFSRELWDFRNVVFLCSCIPTNWYPPTLHLRSHCYTGSAGQNKQHLVTKNTAKLDRETEELHHDRVTLEVGKVIQKGRQDKGLTQKDLATVSVKTVVRFCG